MEAILVNHSMETVKRFLSITYLLTQVQQIPSIIAIDVTTSC